MGLLETPPSSREKLVDMIARRAKADLSLLEKILASIPPEMSPQAIIFRLALLKTDYYITRLAALVAACDQNAANPAVILPLPPHLLAWLEELVPAEMFFNPLGHSPPPHDLSRRALPLPTKPREVREQFRAISVIGLEGCLLDDGTLGTRAAVADFLELLEDGGIRPHLMVHLMPHRHPELEFARIADGWTVAEI
ncbi:MAG: hypothetical protein KA257_08905 [Opitutaceae bacterium]|nr:hypothetical protein [Opitutaceae bacterium]